jgi:flagellum-specific peptidoglycan hydrolase FlgJ
MYHQTSKKHLQKEVQYTILDQVTLRLLFRRMSHHTKRLFTILNNLFHSVTFGTFAGGRIPWIQLTVIGLIVFIVLKKDLHFQLKMNAPLSATTTNTATSASRAVEQMSLLQPVKLVESKPEVVLHANLAQDKVESYIKRFGKIAITESSKFGIPASIKMAQGILESQAGEIAAAKAFNNHFGAPMGEMDYGSAWENWRAHSLYLTEATSPFQPLLKFGMDYKKWARGLKDLGYSNQPGYDQLLIGLIEQYEMYRLDAMVK